MIEIWDGYVQGRKETISPTTLNVDFRRVRKKLESCPVAISDSEKFRKWLDENYSPEVTRRTLVQIKAACDWGVSSKLLKNNPFGSIPKRKPKDSSPQPFTKKEMELIISTFENSYHYAYYAPFVRFQFLTGARTSEGIGLQWKQIDEELAFINFSQAFVNGRFKDTKNHKDRRFPINQSLKELLQEIRPAFIKPEQLVFPSKKGHPIDGHNFSNRAWKSVMGKLPNVLYRRFYSTRATFISNCLEKGAPVTLVAEWVGNSPEVIWESYAGVVSSMSVPEF